MRTIFLLGGFTGFVLVALTGFAAGRENDLVLRDAAIGCLVGAMLFRWCWGVWMKALAQAVAAKRKAQVAAEEAAAAKAASASGNPAPAKAR